ncbi:MAG: hypothetical protein KC636_19215, partial [Myxococcales bacterium]|nr:hypothetical protein [Myxococcales bacterium]
VGLTAAACTGTAVNETDAPEADDTTADAAGSNATDTDGPDSDEPSTTTDPAPPTGSDGDASTGTSSPGDDTGSTEDAPFCGDGLVDPAEECDDGLDNANDGPCTLECTAAACGDGLIWAGHEACDDGNDSDDDACVAGCVPASCGDGFLFVGAEECEPGDIDDNGEYACGLDCTWSPIVAPPRRVFLSSVSFYGDLSIHAPSLGDYALADFPDGGKTGVLLADARCQALAVLGGLAQKGDPPSFHAWLSDNNGSELSSAVDRLQPQADPQAQAGYTLPGGPMIATSFAGLTQGLMAAILKDEQGALVMGAPYVWSNTAATGEALGKVDAMGHPTSCESWHSASADRFGQIGAATQAQPAWTDAGAVQFCSTAWQLYCFEGG